MAAATSTTTDVEGYVPLAKKRNGEFGPGTTFTLTPNTDDEIAAATKFINRVAGDSVLAVLTMLDLRELAELDPTV